MSPKRDIASKLPSTTLLVTTLKLVLRYTSILPQIDLLSVKISALIKILQLSFTATLSSL